MIQLIPHRFITVAIVNIISMLAGCYIIKKYIKQFPEHLIPIFSLVMEIIVSTLWCYFGAVESHAFFYIFVGAIEGLATTGVYQVYKQMKRHFMYKKNIKHVKSDRRKRDRKIS